MKKNAIIMILALVVSMAAAILGCKSSGPSNPGSGTPTPQSSPTITPTVTRTSTPAGGSVAGNLVLPSAQTGITWQVLVDTNTNFADGIVNMALGTCGISSNVPYSVTAPAGTYYVYAVVKTASELTQPPVQGDYIGSLGATWPAWSASANLAVIEGSMAFNADINMVLAANNVTGNITFPAAADLSNILLALDSDNDGSNGGISFMSINQIPNGTGTTYGYGLLVLSAGNWYIYGMVDNDASGLPGAPTAHDFVGIVGPVSMDPAVPLSQEMTWTEIP
jgi:hypothetical protein